MKRIKLLGPVAIILICVSCAAPEKKDPNVTNVNLPAPAVPANLLNDFKKGTQFLDESNYSAAEKIFRRLVVEHPSSQFHLVSLYNLGAAYEGLQKCKEAGATYRRVARSSLGKYPRLEAQSLFRMSFAYSCLGHDEKAIASLLDARRRGKILQEEVVLAEIPARIAAAYARIGNKKKAKQFFEVAKKGIQRIRDKNKNRKSIRDILAKTLFLMGRMQPLEARATVDPLEYLTTLQQLQLYLLESTELNSAVWSPQAADEIGKAYENIWKLVENVKVQSTDNEYKTQKTIDEQFKVVSEALANLKLLKNSFRPDLESKPVLTDLRRELDIKQGQFERYLAENAIENPLSDQAKKREGLRRGGRTRGETALEKSAKEKSQMPEKESIE